MSWAPDDPWRRRLHAKASDVGIDPAYFRATMMAESGGRNVPTGIRNASGQRASSATGPFQFVQGTWDGLMRNYPDAGLTPDGRTNPDQQAIAAPLLAAEELPRIRNAGVESPVFADLYSTHVYGGDRGSRLAAAYRRNPGQRAADIIPREQFQQHGISNPDATVGDVYQHTARAFGRHGDPFAPVEGGAPRYAGPDSVQGAQGSLGTVPAQRQQEGLLPLPMDTTGLGLLGDGGSQQEGRDDMFGGLLGTGESNMPMLLAGLAMMNNAGPSLEPRGMFEGVPQAMMAGTQMQRQQTQDRQQQESRAALESLATEQGIDPRLVQASPEVALGLLAPEQPDHPSSVREYQFARQQGYPGTFEQWQQDHGQRGTVVNVGGEPRYGTIPPGYQLVEGPEGASMQPIPGGPAAREIEAERRAAEVGRQRAGTAAGTVVQDIGRAKEMISGAGPQAAVTRYLPWSEGYQLERMVESIQGNIGVDQLQQMRDASPTGGALGNVTERQLSMLTGLLGSLDITQERDTLRQNLDRVEDIYLDIIHGTPDQIRQQVESGNLDPEVAAQISQRNDPFGVYGGGGSAQPGGLLSGEPMEQPSSRIDIEPLLPLPDEAPRRQGQPTPREITPEQADEQMGRGRPMEAEAGTVGVDRIRRMSMDQLNALDDDSLTIPELRAAAERFNELDRQRVRR